MGSVILRSPTHGMSRGTRNTKGGQFFQWFVAGGHFPTKQGRACDGPNVQGTFKEHSVAFSEHSVAFREHSVTFREHSVAFREHSVAFREHSVAFREHSVAFRKHSGNICCAGSARGRFCNIRRLRCIREPLICIRLQGTFREHSGNIQGTFRL